MKTFYYDSRFSGMACSADEGRIAVTYGEISSGFLWWKKTTYHWFVRMVRMEFDAAVNSYFWWRTIEAFDDFESAREFADKMIERNLMNKVLTNNR